MKERPTYEELEQRVRELEQRIASQDRSQGKIQEAQRMQAVATLAGGIAHQFNNALASISLSMDLMRMDLPKDDPLLGHIRKIRSSTERMALLTSQLLAYAEGGRFQTRLISMQGFVRDFLPGVTRELGPSVRLYTDLPPDTITVKADANQLQMVLSALLHNAAEAMEGGGSIRVSIRNEVVGNKGKTTHDLAPGPYACLSVEDDGKGMDEETRKRIFEPFFTTKFHGRGLGLPAVYGIIKGHNGCVVVDSEAGKGTKVRVYFPAFESAEKKPQIRERKPLKGVGTLLIIEDDGSVMSVSKELLERIGYRVLTARTGKDALRVSAGFKEKIDLAMLDVVLPDMGGKEVYQRLLEGRPELRVLVCSGYSIDGPAQEILKAGAQGFIQKPFSFLELNRRLQEIMKQTGKGGTNLSARVNE